MTRTDLTEYECAVIDALRQRQKDSLVQTAIHRCTNAAINLSRNGRYNDKGVTFKDYLPNGIKDAFRYLLETFVRAHTSGKPDQADDSVGVTALLSEWVLRGMPESQFETIVVEYENKFFGLLKELDTKNGVKINSPTYSRG